MHRQIVILASSVETNITAWDIHTGTQLATYKANASPRNGLSLLGRDYIVAAQAAKDALQFWTWHKDQAIQRSFVVERINAVCGTQCGTYIAAGGASGSLYIWEAASGRLLRSWSAHYKGVTCLAFTESGLTLLSGAEDTLACVWLLPELLDVAADKSDPAYHRPQPLYSWSEHTLPVTSITVGLGEASAIVVTSSLDRTVKIHRMSDGRLLATAALPSGINCVALDAGEHAMYAGGTDGAIYEISLVGNHSGGSGGASEAMAMSRLGSGGFGVMSSSSAAAAVSSSLATSSALKYTRMEGHSRAVNAVSISPDGETMVSGSDDGTAFVWDLRSRQAVQVIQGPGKHPVTSVVVMAQPVFMVAGGVGGASTTGGGSAGRQGPKVPQPLAPLVKYTGMSGTLKPWEGPAIIIDGSRKYQGIAQQCGLWGVNSSLPPPMPSLLSESCIGSRMERVHFSAASSISHQDLDKGVDGIDGLTSGKRQRTEGKSAPGEYGAVGVDKGGADRLDHGLEAEVERLKQELKKAQGRAKEWQSMYSELHKAAVQSVLE